jgi:nucleoside-diphosphate-sugar epimerase
MKILITGATGFVGQQLCTTALDRGYSLRTTVRLSSQPHQLPSAIEIIPIDSIASPLPDNALQGIDVIVHLAARVHIMKDTNNDPLAANREINTAATLSLARQAAKNGVKRFIYLSSIKVNGEGGLNQDKPYTEQDTPYPSDPYGISKWEAEQGLQQIAEETGLETVIIRPTLIYGAGVKGNFKQLMRLVQLGLPLPFGAIDNSRSLVYLGNLVDAILTCITHPAAKNQTFLISDGEDLSTPELIRRLANHSSKSVALLPIPTQILNLLGKLTGQISTLDRLLGSLVVGSSHIQTTLDWQPPYTVEQGLSATAKWYLEQGN